MKNETNLTDKQEKLLKTVIIKNLTDKSQEYLNDKLVVKVFPMIVDITEKILAEFNETDLINKANEIIREEIKDEENN